MSINNDITKQKQLLARAENALSIEKIKKRKKETRHKIELGGLIIKAGLHYFDKDIILGVLLYGARQIDTDRNYQNYYSNIGKNGFLKSQSFL